MLRQVTASSRRIANVCLSAVGLYVPALVKSNTPCLGLLSLCHVCDRMYRLVDGLLLDVCASAKLLYDTLIHMLHAHVRTADSFPF